MTSNPAPRRSPARKPTRAAEEVAIVEVRSLAPAEQPADEPAVDRVETPDRCNVPGCDASPEWRGLCSAHRQTHRGLAGPKAGAPL